MPPPLPSLWQHAPLHRRILGSVLAAGVGWAALTLLLAVFIRYAVGSFGFLQSAPLESMMTLAFFTGLAVFFVWTTLILPIYVFTSAGSIFWSWPVSVAGGFLAGMGVVAVFAASSLASDGLFWAAIFAGGPGALTGLFATLTANRFHRVRADFPPYSSPAPPPLPIPPH